MASCRRLAAASNRPFGSYGLSGSALEVHRIHHALIERADRACVRAKELAQDLLSLVLGLLLSLGGNLGGNLGGWLVGRGAD
jgi:hypothetical protein